VWRHAIHHYRHTLMSRAAAAAVAAAADKMLTGDSDAMSASVRLSGMI